MLPSMLCMHYVVCQPRAAACSDVLHLSSLWYIWHCLLSMVHSVTVTRQGTLSPQCICMLKSHAFAHCPHMRYSTSSVRPFSLKKLPSVSSMPSNLFLHQLSSAQVLSAARHHVHIRYGCLLTFAICCWRQKQLWLECSNMRIEDEEDAPSHLFAALFAISAPTPADSITAALSGADYRRYISSIL